MKATEYDAYVKTVQAFLEDFDGEPSTGRWDNEDGEPEEPFFSWYPCQCCRRPLGGDREDVIGWRKGAREHGYTDEYRWEGAVCQDCLYYFTYGHLDDMTELDVATDRKAGE